MTAVKLNSLTFPKFSATRTSPYTTVANIATKLPINIVEYDTHGGFSTINSRYTIPTGYAGKWHFSARYSIASTTMYSWIEIRKNGTLVKRGSLGTPNNEYIGHIISIDIDVTINDYIELWYQTGQARDVETGQTTIYFQGRFLP